jgi:hypothetical protein
MGAKVKSDCRECENKRWTVLWKDETRDVVLTDKEYRKLREYSEKEMQKYYDAIPAESKLPGKGDKDPIPFMAHILDGLVQHEKRHDPNIASILLALKVDDEKTKNYTSQVINCPECHVPELLERHSQLSHSRLVDLVLINELHKDGKLSDQIVKLSKEPVGSFMVIGKSHLGKSVLLKYNFNRILKKKEGKMKDMLFITEYELKSIMENDDATKTFIKKLDGIRYLLMDEFFSLDMWIDQGSETERHIAGVRRANVFNLWEYLEQRGPTIVTQIAANNDPAKLLMSLNVPDFDKKKNRIENVAGKIIFLGKSD